MTTESPNVQVSITSTQIDHASTEPAETGGLYAGLHSSKNLHDASIPGSSMLVQNPPKSAVKGRNKSKRLSNGMNAQPKSKKKCSRCGSNEHTTPRCPSKQK